jgi:hypothetical protein
MGSQVDIFIEQNLIESFQEKVYSDKDLSIFLINLDEIGDWTQSTKCFTESISKSSESNLIKIRSSIRSSFFFYCRYTRIWRNPVWGHLPVTFVSTNQIVTAIWLHGISEVTTALLAKAKCAECSE